MESPDGPRDTCRQQSAKDAEQLPFRMLDMSGGPKGKRLKVQKFKSRT